MSKVRLPDQLYKDAQRHASEAGYATVDEYVADIVSDDLADGHVGQTPNLDHLFTPERLAKIDAAAAEIKAGKFYTAAEAKAELAKRRAEWIQKNER